MKSFDIIAEVTRFLNVVYSNINSKNIDLVIQLFESMNEFTAVSVCVWGYIGGKVGL